MISQDPGLIPFNNPFSEVRRSSGNVMNRPRRVIVPIPGNGLFNSLASAGFPSHMPCCASRTLCTFTIWQVTRTILKPRLDTWRNFKRSIIVRRMLSVNSAPANMQPRSRMAWKCSLLWANSRNVKVTLLGKCFYSCKASSFWWS